MFDTVNECTGALCRVPVRWMLCLALALLGAAGRGDAQQPVTPRFRLAIVGLAHGHSFIAFRTLTSNSNVEVVAISDASADLRAQAAGIWPGVPLFENHEKLMDDVKPDGVWAFVDNHRHLEITKACAERGISVMFEKPMATSYADAVAIRDVAKARGIQVVINSQPPWDLPRNIQQLEVFGDRGSVDLVSNSGSQLIRFETWQGRERREVPLAVLEPHWADPATYFAYAVRRRQVDEFVGAAFHTDVMAILEAGQRSADSGLPVAITDITSR